MTPADVEAMQRELAETTRYLRETGRRMREAARHLDLAADHLHEIGTRTDAAITAGLIHLHGEHEDQP